MKIYIQKSCLTLEVHCHFQTIHRHSFYNGVKRSQEETCVVVRVIVIVWVLLICFTRIRSWLYLRYNVIGITSYELSKFRKMCPSRHCSNSPPPTPFYHPLHSPIYVSSQSPLSNWFPFTFKYLLLKNLFKDFFNRLIW